MSCRCFVWCLALLPLKAVMPVMLEKFALIVYHKNYHLKNKFHSLEETVTVKSNRK